jgi:DNA polymerase-4
MDSSDSTIVHINVTDFLACVAIAKERELQEKAFVIAYETSGRSVVINSSMCARKEGIEKGMYLSTAIKLAPHLRIIAPDETASLVMQKSLYTIAAEYAPSIQNNLGGHLYLDMIGTSRLFGPVIDSAVHISKNIYEQLSLQPAIAIASNKLVAKIATRAIRPSGITHIPKGEEKDFLYTQDISFLPGISPATYRLLQVAGVKEIGTIANLGDEQSIALLGKNGIALRNSARGEDSSRIECSNLEERTITAHVDFAQGTQHMKTIEAALIRAVEDIGVQLRRESLGCHSIDIYIYWADKKITMYKGRSNDILMWDSQLIENSKRWLDKALQRRLHVIAIELRAHNLTPYIQEPELFEELSFTKTQKIQHSVDTVRLRFGNHLITRATTLYHG